MNLFGRFAGIACAGLVVCGAARAESSGVAAGPTAVPGLDLWRGARVGMSVSQVRTLFRRASAPPTLDVLTGGEVDRLQLAGVDLDATAATAHFYFDGKGLVSVQLSLTGLRPAASAANRSLAEHISADLSRRYGAGYDCGDKSFADIAAFECKWLSKPLSIRLWYMDVAGQAPLFYLAFRQADDPGYDL